MTYFVEFQNKPYQFNITDYTDEDIIDYIIQIYENTTKDINYKRLINDIKLITTKFQQYVAHTHITLCNSLYELLDGDIPGITQEKLRSMQELSNKLQKEQFKNKIVDTCVERIFLKTFNIVYK
jgi:hypothetical protein